MAIIVRLLGVHVRQWIGAQIHILLFLGLLVSMRSRRSEDEKRQCGHGDLVEQPMHKPSLRRRAGERARLPFSQTVFPTACNPALSA